MGKKLGDAEDPLLVSVRSGAPFSMPGMMDTVLNLSLIHIFADPAHGADGQRREEGPLGPGEDDREAPGLLALRGDLCKDVYKRQGDVVVANARDMARAREAGMSDGLLDRLMLDEGRVRSIASAMDEVAAQPDRCV